MHERLLEELNRHLYLESSKTTQLKSLGLKGKLEFLKVIAPVTTFLYTYIFAIISIILGKIK